MESVTNWSKVQSIFPMGAGGIPKIAHTRKMMCKSKSGLGLDLDLSPIFIENGLDLDLTWAF